MHENFFHEIKVYYEDTDSGGVVYYANYLKYLERARSEAIYSLGLSNTILQALTIIKDPNLSLIVLLLYPIENKPSVLALSKNFK